MAKKCGILIEIIASVSWVEIVWYTLKCVFGKTLWYFFYNSGKPLALLGNWKKYLLHQELATNLHAYFEEIFNLNKWSNLQMKTFKLILSLYEISEEKNIEIIEL